MGLFKKIPVQRVSEQDLPQQAAFRGSLENLIAVAGQQSLYAHSDFVKQVDCPRCGARKRLPSKTAYLYCDHCGSLIDYDYRLANSGTNAGLTNTVYHHLESQVAAQLSEARAAGDADQLRRIYQWVFGEWVAQCPEAVSPRARSDEGFRARMVAYMAASAAYNDLDPQLAQISTHQAMAEAVLQRLPQPGGAAWLVSDGIWRVAELFKQHMDLLYQRLAENGILAMDPDQPPPGMPLRMEYSTFCQGWIPHLRPADAERLLAMFGLTSEYTKVDLSHALTRRCGGCGDELKALPGAKAVVCESCGRKLDLAGGETPCRTCGAPLSFPVGVSRLACPYCDSDTHRI